MEEPHWGRTRVCTEPGAPGEALVEQPLCSLWRTRTDKAAGPSRPPSLDFCVLPVHWNKFSLCRWVVGRRRGRRGILRTRAGPSAGADWACPGPWAGRSQPSPRFTVGLKKIGIRWRRGAPSRHDAWQKRRGGGGGGAGQRRETLCVYVAVGVGAGARAPRAPHVPPPTRLPTAPAPRAPAPSPAERLPANRRRRYSPLPLRGDVREPREEALARGRAAEAGSGCGEPARAEAAAQLALRWRSRGVRAAVPSAPARPAPRERVRSVSPPSVAALGPARPQRHRRPPAPGSLWGGGGCARVLSQGRAARGGRPALRRPPGALRVGAWWGGGEGWVSLLTAGATAEHFRACFQGVSEEGSWLYGIGCARSLGSALSSFHCYPRVSGLSFLVWFVFFPCWVFCALRVSELWNDLNFVLVLA